MLAAEQQTWLDAELAELARLKREGPAAAGGGGGGGGPVHLMVFTHIPPFIRSPAEPDGYVIALPFPWPSTAGLCRWRKRHCPSLPFPLARLLPFA